MRNILCIVLFIVLCSNECNAPYDAKFECRATNANCKFHFHNSLEFSIISANVSWWRGSLDVGIYYHVRNTSPDNKDSIDFSRFSMVCSNGLVLKQGGADVKQYTVPAAATRDTLFLFYTANKYHKKDGMKILKNERFFLRYSDGAPDTLLTVTQNDSRIR